MEQFFATTIIRAFPMIGPVSGTALTPLPGFTSQRRLDMNLSKFKRYPLTFGPSPITPLKRLSEHLGGKVQLYAKREDCNSGLAFGGNKTRKLEYLVPEAIEGGYDTLVSIGGIQSNQTRQVAAVAAHLGMKCVLVQENWVNYSDALYDRVGNIEMSRIMGADVRLDSAGFDIGIRPSWEKAMADVVESGGKPFPIPAGCSEHPFGGLGFVRFADEVRQQEEELGFKFDYIVVCSVTGSTHAGMLVGFAADGRAQRVIGIDASAKPDKTREQVLRIARNTAKLVELGRDITAEDVVLDTRYAYPEYGLPNEGTLEAIRLCARLEGVLTDPVYEGKSMHGMIDRVRNGEFPDGSKVLYAHLGGVPALNAYSFLFKDG
ncbi:1-aminocyclopropane-1-carboxylate deaminase [Pseudomonas viridiflava]|uniref:1-aminocyclopropane-1-carboxylate deaminase n=2 Tax=Pseudomonas TaxID=286 RepID=A0A3M5PHR0_PSEVI|nr:1-aminocyclopropane-1-carboxylate deaminase [Pseudomonas viridiflava]